MARVAKTAKKVNTKISATHAISEVSPKIYHGLDLVPESRLKEILNSCADKNGVTRLRMIPVMERTTRGCVAEFFGVHRTNIGHMDVQLGYAYCNELDNDSFGREIDRLGLCATRRARTWDVCGVASNSSGCEKITVSANSQTILYSYHAVANMIMHRRFHRYKNEKRYAALCDIRSELKREIESELQKASKKEAKSRKKQPASVPEQLTIQPVIPAEQPAMMPQMDGITDTKRTISELLYMAVKLTVQESLVDITKTLNELTTTVNAIK